MERFWAKVEKTETCWLWRGAVRHPSRRDLRAGGQNRPHGQFWFQGRKAAAHRVAFMLSRDLPDLSFGLIAHACDNPRCVRPDHLELSDPSRNLQDAWDRQRRARREQQNLVELRAWFDANPDSRCHRCDGAIAPKGQDMTKTKQIHYWVYVGDKLVFDGPEDAAWAVASGLFGAKLHREPLPPTKGQGMTTTKMTFGDALEALKKGARVAREGWNGKGMWLALVPEQTLPYEETVGRRRYYFAEGDIRCEAYIMLRTAQGVRQPGWLASQADMLAEDWFVLPEDAP